MGFHISAFWRSYYINEIIERKDTDHITGCAYGDKRTDGLYEGTFYRSTDKKAPQNAYASAEGINKGINKLGISKTYRDEYYNADHFKFASSKEPNTLEKYSDAITAKEIDMASAYPITKTLPIMKTMACITVICTAIRMWMLPTTASSWRSKTFLSSLHTTK